MMRAERWKEPNPWLYPPHSLIRSLQMLLWLPLQTSSLQPHYPTNFNSQELPSLHLDSPLIPIFLLNYSYLPLPWLTAYALLQKT